MNNARSHFRRRHGRTSVSISERELPDRGPDMQQTLADHELVVRALARLPKQYREPLLLKLASGLTCQEIGAIMHSSEGAIKVRLMRAREAFRRAYEEEAAG